MDSANHTGIRRELALTRACAAVTVLASAAFLVASMDGLRSRVASGAGIGEAAAYLLLVSFLLYGGLVYQFARLGYLRRLQAHAPPDRSEVEAAGLNGAPSVAILVPSYKEEPQVVRKTLLSAALQSYPNRRVVLLIDDPPLPDDEDSAAELRAARLLPGEISAVLARPAALCRARFEELRGRLASHGDVGAPYEALRLARLHEEVAGWFEEQAARFPCGDHTDALFVEEVLVASAAGLRDDAGELRRRACRSEECPDGRELEARCWRLVRRFDVEVTSFERKRYAGLSHAPNKAMNLNGYIGLLGRGLREVPGDDGLRLEPVRADRADLVVPDADYVLTLDADSLLVPDYAATLVCLMERPASARIAVAQTPYSAIPGATRPVERIAGATTDVQYMIHQGFTRHRATFWVGANALLRKAALEEIATDGGEGGDTARRYIQDRTVIEDTESSVDLIDRGWDLFNYPERLAFSATPPDFGALVIQRRRWANGGLIILPKLLRYVLRPPWRLAKLPEAAMRVHYLVSLATANLALLLLLLYPFEGSLATVWLPLTAVPYFLLYSRDLVGFGYGGMDVVRVYALNLILVGVNLGGVAKSVHQACTGRPTPFRRTPKTDGRTAAPALYVAIPYVLLAYLAFVVCWDVSAGRWAHAAVAGMTVVLLAHGLSIFIGWREAREDAFRLGRRAGSPTRAGLGVEPG